MEQILRNSCSLSLPVKPETSRAVMEMVLSDNNIDGRMHLDSAYFRARKVLLVVYVVNMIVLDDREYTAEMSDDTGLSAIMNIVVSYYVGTVSVFVPALNLSLADAVTLGLGTVFVFPFKPLVIVVALEVFTKRNTRALRLKYIAVLYDPSL